MMEYVTVAGRGTSVNVVTVLQVELAVMVCFVFFLICFVVLANHNKERE